MGAGKKIKERARREPVAVTVTIEGESTVLSAAGVPWRERMRLLFPDPIAIGALADSFRQALNLGDFPDDLVISASMIVAVWPSDDEDRPSEADLVQLALVDPSTFHQLEFAANQALGFLAGESKRDGIFEWRAAYSTLRRAYQLLGAGDVKAATKLIVEVGGITKRALADNNVELPDVDDDADDAVLETLRGNSAEAPSAGA